MDCEHGFESDCPLCKHNDDMRAENERLKKRHEAERDGLRNQVEEVLALVTQGIKDMERLCCDLAAVTAQRDGLLNAAKAALNANVHGYLDHDDSCSMRSDAPCPVNIDGTNCSCWIGKLRDAIAECDGA